eukprot:c27839_g1_i1 orf=619-2934(-)
MEPPAALVLCPQHQQDAREDGKRLEQVEDNSQNREDHDRMVLNGNVKSPEQDVSFQGETKPGLMSDEVIYPSAADLVAKGRAPLKREFLRQAAVRVIATGDSAFGYSNQERQAKDKKETGGPEENRGAKVSAEKKSKRQQKRERMEAKKSLENLCSTVARTGDVKSCSYGANCNFNHDLSAFIAQKPMDLPGKCPFLTVGNTCPFGIACRFAGTHGGCNWAEERSIHSVQSCELNSLNKDLQKRLWKHAVLFPKADAQLQLLGILGKGKQNAVKKLSREEPLVNAKEPESTYNVEKASKDIMFLEEKRSPVDNDSNIITLGETKFIGNSLSQGDVLEEEAISSFKRARTNLIERFHDKGNDANGVEGKSCVHSDAVASQVVLEAICADNSQSDGDVSAPRDYMECKLTKREKKIIDFKGKLYLAPLTTVGNLPFRRLCKQLGADITCGEMAMCTNLLQGQASEWALLRRHSTEDVFGVQICGAHADTVARTAEVIEKECEVNFIDINVGCPIDIVVNKGAGSCLLTRPARLEQIIKATSATIHNPLTLKVRTGYFEGRKCIHTLVAGAYKWGASALTIHGRTRQQRYSKLADWDYIYQCASLAPDDFQVIGNGDIFAYTDWNEHLNTSKLSSCLVARGALIKPWLFTEIKEQRHWDISAGERLDIFKDYVHFGLEHWGSDTKGVETTRHFLLEWLSYTHRYIPLGLLEIVPQRLNWRSPNYFGRNDLETLMASDSAADWVRISEMLLGPVPASFVFTPKHKSNAYDKAENG